MHTVVYYSTTKKTKILIYAITWLNTENIMLHGRSQVQKDTYGYDSHVFEMSRMAKSIDIK